MSKEFNFKTEAECLNFLAELRWPGGKFRCPACNGCKGSNLSKRAVIQCSDCKKQTSITSGSIFHGSRISILKLFKLIWELGTGFFVSTAKAAREYELPYSTVWVWTQKFRKVIMEAAIDTHALLQVPWEELKQVLFRPSSEIYAGKQKKEDQIQEGEKKPAFPESNRFAIFQAQRFISSIFHGVSRKYSQIYVTVPCLPSERAEESFVLLLKRLISRGRISLTEILAYTSPDLLSIPAKITGKLSISLFETKFLPAE